MAFQQQVTSWHGNQVVYRIATTDGYHVTVGRRVSHHFAAERVDGRYWHLTHLPSGRCLPGGHRRTLHEAIAMAEALESIADWSAVKQPSKALQARVREITGCGLRVVA